ncbi:hypothetical protein ACJJTC_015546 [Scirpophaga incertulas]
MQAVLFMDDSEAFGILVELAGLQDCTLFGRNKNYVVQGLLQNTVHVRPRGKIYGQRVYNAFRMLLGLMRYCGVLSMSADAHADGFDTIICKSSAQLMNSICGSVYCILETAAGVKAECSFLRYFR